MKLYICESEKELILAFAKFFIEQAEKFIQATGRFNVVLSGGSSPKKVYELLASLPFREKTDWSKIYFFFGDERYVPVTDPQYNGLMAENTLFSPLQIPPEQIFKIDTSLPPAESAGNYFERIVTHFNHQPVRFDLILLGLGDDGHTASLFPFTAVLNEKVPTVKAVSLDKDHSTRISMTAPLINQARHVAFLVFGEQKAVAVEKVIKGSKNPEEFPAQLIAPENGDLHWFMDEKAAEGLMAD